MALTGQAPSSSPQTPAAPPAAEATAAKQDAPAPATDSTPKKKDYVGSETCSTCHEDIAKSFERDRHHAIETAKKKDWEGKSCESCHGPGSVHAESVDPKDINRKNAAACNSCHANQKKQASRMQSAHGRNQIDCFGCHTMHKPAVVGVARAAQINNNCGSCHVTTLAQFKKPHRHPLDQVMSCADCHDPHGGPLPKMVRAVNASEANCVRCHGNVRGPFTFEHAPVRLEGCGACHEPHGSTNPRMLNRHEERLVCLECHANVGNRSILTNTTGGLPPAIHDLRSPRFRVCSTCHVKVHGSHASRSLLR